MIDLGKYMYAELEKREVKTNNYAIFSRASNKPLGRVRWHTIQLQYCFITLGFCKTALTHFDLREIEKFLKKLNAEHRQKRGKG